MHLLKRIYRRLRWGADPDFVEVDGVRLPPPRLRFCGPEFKDDSYFLASAQREADRVRDLLELGAPARVLDVGCGPGRLAIGLLSRNSNVAEYRGVDVHRPSIEWCARHIAQGRPKYQFQHFDFRNRRYNPGGTSGPLELPLPDRAYDVIYLYSVFSHLLKDDLNAYLEDFDRLLSANGTLFFTGFVEEGVPNVTENPDGYRREWAGDLHCVRYDRSYLERVLAENGFRIDRFDYETETDGQSAVYCRRLI